ncbi:MAG: hypothetical protein ABJ263_00270, partial [Tateyamaria sp.]|uniref:hypothetical protein n=1 Tax=Tateyamaria sp. TaxID=1929288 RepID=UPI0032949F29
KQHATHKSARFFSANENGVATYKQALISTAAFSSIRRSLRQFPMSQLRTKRPCAHAAIAYAASVRSSNKRIAAMQPVPPERTLKSGLGSRIQTDLSLPS